MVVGEPAFGLNALPTSGANFGRLPRREGSLERSGGAIGVLLFGFLLRLGVAWSAGDGEDAGGSVARLGVEFWPMLRPSCSCAARAGVSAGNAYNKKSFQIRN